MSSLNNLSVDGEFRYIVQWFSEWSELQREDFVPILCEYLMSAPPTSSVYMNGVVHSMNTVNLSDKPMSLFQCRIKLFRQWNPKWPNEFKEKLRERVNEMDARIGEKVTKSLLKQQNGDVSNDIEAIEEFPNEVEETTSSITTTSAVTLSPTINIIPSSRSYARQFENNSEVNDIKIEEESIEETSIASTLSTNAPILATNDATTSTAAAATSLLISAAATNTAAISTDENLAEVLRKETAVDDEDDDNNVAHNDLVATATNVVQDNITRVTVNATDNITDVTLANAYEVETVDPKQVEHVIANPSPVTVNVSVSTAAEVPLVA